MEGLHLFNVEHWQPLAVFGFTNPFFSINAATVINTWILLGLFVIILIPLRIFLTRNTVIAYLISSGISSFMTLCQQTLGSFSFQHFSFITSLFIFLLCANTLGVIPYLKEPTEDLNTTLALGIISFFYIQISAIRHHGLVEYIKEYFVPFFIMFPLHLVGKLATIVSMSFRLFGNIFGGATISNIYFNMVKGSALLEVLGLFSTANLIITLFFGLFEGFLQAFVFTMLSLTYLSIALQTHEKEPTSWRK
jgi:F-type H+-transporting ATPase subunit a